MLSSHIVEKFLQKKEKKVIAVVIFLLSRAFGPSESAKKGEIIKYKNFRFNAGSRIIKKQLRRFFSTYSPCGAL